LFSVDDQIVVAPNKYDQLAKVYDQYMIKGISYLQERYPYTIPYNAAVVGNYVIHNFEHTDETIKNLIKKKELIPIDINQGYSKCNIAIVDDHSIITSDKGIYKTLLNYPIDVLLIQPGHIQLSHMSYGFIGGCCGKVEDQLVFYGDISKHPDFERIYKFIKDRNIKIKWFDFPLEDIGSIIKLTIE
jgi:hypothetical protein